MDTGRLTPLDCLSKVNPNKESQPGSGLIKEGKFVVVTIIEVTKLHKEVT